MPFSDTNVFARDDTFFGVCQAIGEDLGFNPNYLRIAFALPLLYAPVTTVGAYFGLALLVLLTRLVLPNPSRAQVTDTVEEQKEATRPADQNEPMPIAA